jgi:transcription initiation factor TFIIH subunit 4
MSRTTNILEYLISLVGVDNNGVLDRLYADAFTTMTVFRSLPPVAKQIIMRLLISEGQIKCSVLDTWLCNDSVSKQVFRVALNRLEGLHIFQKQKDIWIVNDKFLASLRKSVNNEVKVDATSFNQDENEVPIATDVLDQHAHNAWERMLHFMVNCSDPQHPPAPSVKAFLVESKLMSYDSFDDTGYAISDAGLVFLFKNRQQQVWDCVLTYLDIFFRCQLANQPIATQMLIQDQAFQILFRMSFLQPNQGYSFEQLEGSQQIIVADFVDLGLLYAPPEAGDPQSANNAEEMNAGVARRSFYGTALSQKLGSCLDLADREHNGFLLVETNFAVFAYTTSPVHFAMLKLFVDLQVC